MTYGNYMLDFPLERRNYLVEILQSKLNILKFLLFFSRKIFKSFHFYFECFATRSLFFSNKKLKIKNILKKNDHIIQSFRCDNPRLGVWNLDMVYQNFFSEKTNYKKIFNQEKNDAYLNHNKLKVLFQFISKSKSKKSSDLKIQKVFLKKKSTKKKSTKLTRFEFVLYFVLLLKFYKMSNLYSFLYLHLKKFDYVFMDTKNLNLNLNIRLHILNQAHYLKKPASLWYNIKNFHISTSSANLYYEIKMILYKLILYDIFGPNFLKFHMKNIRHTTIYIVLNVVCYFEYMFKSIKVKILNMINLYEIFTKYNLLCKQFIPYGDFYCFFFRNKLKIFFGKKNNKIIN